MKGGGDVRFSCLPHAPQSNRYRCLEWTLVRRCPNDHNPKVEQNPEHSQGDEDTCNGGIDRRHVLAQPAGEEEEGNLEHDREALDEEVEGPLLQSIALPLTICGALDRRPAGVPEVPIEPLLSQHCDECGKKRDQETRIHQPGDGDDLAGRAFLGGWDGGGFVRDGRLVEGEEDRAEEGCGLLVRIGLETRVDVDDEGRADGGEQTRLQGRVRLFMRANDKDHLRRSRWY